MREKEKARAENNAKEKATEAPKRGVEVDEEKVGTAISHLPCTNFLTLGKCDYGDECRYEHMDLEALTKRQKEKKKEKKSKKPKEGDTSGDKKEKKEKKKK